VYSEVTRLLLELNRSPHHPKWLSRWSQDLSSLDREKIRAELYDPYRKALREQIDAVVAEGGVCLHASVHSFTPVYHGVPRKTDIGLLYDPKRYSEKEVCAVWARGLREILPSCVVRRNHPYLGAADGLTTALRKEYDPGDYLGVEIEVKNSLLIPEKIPEIAEGLSEALRLGLGQLD
jgi:predicted N-formylglutamate amidohydrolase